jgi:hypothetical protein
LTTRHYFLAAWLYVYVNCKISFNHETTPASMAISKSFSSGTIGQEYCELYAQYGYRPY